jgi:predicted Zn-dependent protease
MPIAKTRAAFLQKLDGLIVGADAREGVFEETTFLHPELGFHLRFPDGWKTSNGKTAVGASSPARDAVVALEFQTRGTDPRAAAESFVADRRISVSEAGALLVSGLSAYRVVGVAQTERGGIPVMLTFIAYREVIYRVTGLASASVFQERRAALEATAASFGALSPAERARISQKRLRLVSARAGETIDQLGARVRSAWSPEEIAIANALETGTRLEGGRLVKFARAEPLATSPRATRGDEAPSPLGGGAQGNPPRVGNP